MDVIRACDGGVLVDVLVQPNAHRSEVVGIHGDRIKVRVSAPPERLKANTAVVSLLTETVGVRKGQVVAGRTTRAKTVELLGATVEGAVEALIGR